MKCKDFREEIDQSVFEKVFIPSDEISEHAALCDSCRKYYEKAIKAGNIMDIVRRSDPVLKEPARLKTNILATIAGGNEQMAKYAGTGSSFNRRILMLQRLLAAASVCLLLTFGFEQYVIIERITKLETQNQAVSAEMRYVAINHPYSWVKLKQMGQIKDINKIQEMKLDFLKLILNSTRAGNDTVKTDNKKTD